MYGGGYTCQQAYTQTVSVTGIFSNWITDTFQDLFLFHALLGSDQEILQLGLIVAFMWLKCSCWFSRH